MPYPNQVVGLASGGSRDWRYSEAAGEIADRVLVRPSPDDPEAPFANARVVAFRQIDFLKAWEGHSDAQGNYRATRLQAGMKYVMLAVDPYNQYEAVGAGPVTAVASS